MTVGEEIVYFSRAVGYTMHLTGPTTRSSYGQIVSRAEDVQNMTDMYEEMGSHLAERLLLLEIQDTLYSFMLKVIERSDFLHILATDYRTQKDLSVSSKAATGPVQWCTEPH